MHSRLPISLEDLLRQTQQRLPERSAPGGIRLSADEESRQQYVQFYQSLHPFIREAGVPASSQWAAYQQLYTALLEQLQMEITVPWYYRRFFTAYWQPDPYRVKAVLNRIEGNLENMLQLIRLASLK